MSSPKSACCGAEVRETSELHIERYRCQKCNEPCSIAPPKEEVKCCDYPYKHEHPAPPKEEPKKKTVRALSCPCGEDVYEDDTDSAGNVMCINCNRAHHKSDFEDVEIADVTSEKIAPPKPVEDTGEGKEWLERDIYKWFHDNDIHIHSDKVRPLIDSIADVIEEAESRGIEIGEAEAAKKLRIAFAKSYWIVGKREGNAFKESSWQDAFNDLLPKK